MKIFTLFEWRAALNNIEKNLSILNKNLFIDVIKKLFIWFKWTIYLSATFLVLYNFPEIRVLYLDFIKILIKKKPVNTNYCKLYYFGLECFIQIK